MVIWSKIMKQTGASTPVFDAALKGNAAMMPAASRPIAHSTHWRILYLQRNERAHSTERQAALLALAVRGTMSRVFQRPKSRKTKEPENRASESRPISEQDAQ
jgi:hypothetical protein